jgi:uncharacterized protein (TIGR02996 family)
MHPEAAAFERAILTDPDDRTAQLVYADWLDEHGDHEFAVALRMEEFTRIPAVAAGAGVPLRTAWETSRRLNQLTGTTGAIWVLAATIGPSLLRLARGYLRSAAVGVALAGSPSAPDRAPVTQPQVRRVS